jgi:hypothetical protein
VLLCTGLALFAQEALQEDTGEETESGAASEADPAEEEGEAKEPFHFKDLLPGLILGVEIGTHEHPLTVWYPGQSEEGYSIRSFYFMPNAVYKRSVQQFDFAFELDVTGDLDAPDPDPGAIALNAKDADRTHWFSGYFEQEVAYRFPLDIPGTVSMFLHNQNNFYITPDFPAIPGVRDMAGKKADGIFKPGLAFHQEFPIGVIYTKLTLPLTYLNRYNNDIGFGMDFMAGYKKNLHGMILGFALTPKLAFLPKLKYAETEFAASYTWHDFSLKFTVIVYEAFKSLTITPELKYVCFDGRWTYTLGFEFAGIREARTFSPYMGFAYNF